MRSLIALLVALSLALVACDTGETDADSPAQTPPVSTPTPADEAADFMRCESPEGYSVEYPLTWFTNSGEVVPECGQFSPEPFEVPEATDERVAPITISIDPVAYSRAVESEDEFAVELSRSQVQVDGLDAVRVVQEFTGQGFYNEGVEQTMYIVDLGSGPDGEQPQTLFLNTIDIADWDYESNVELLDRMADSMRITAGRE